MGLMEASSNLNLQPGAHYIRYNDPFIMILLVLKCIGGRPTGSDQKQV